MAENIPTTQGLRADIESFLRDRKAQGLAKGTLIFYREKLKIFTDFAYKEGVEDVFHITPDLIRRFITGLEEHHKPGGISCFYRSLKTFLRWWEAEEEPEDFKNPIKKVKPPRIPDNPIQGLFEGEIEKLLEACPSDFYGLRDKAIFATLLDSGLRASELTNLAFSDLDLVESSILVRQGKNRKPRVVFIGQKTRRTMRAWLRVRGTNRYALFCTTAGEKLSYWGLREILRRRSQDAGMPGCPGLHDFRRSFCLSQLRAGVDILTISRLMGHTTITLVARYAAQTTQDLARKYKSPIDGLE